MTSSGRTLFYHPKSHVWNMNELALKVREKNLPFLSRILSIHALFGCDTTSRINGFGQDRMVKMKDPTKNQLLCQLMDALVEPNQMPKDVVDCGKKILLKLYGAKTETSSNKMGYLLFKTNSRLPTARPFHQLTMQLHIIAYESITR